jgi:integrase
MESAAKRSPGRPSTAAPFMKFVVGTLMTEPAIDSVELLRRARVAGYGGGKSAFYVLVARIRQQYNLPSSAERRAAEKEARHQALQQEKAERRERIAKLAAEAEERRVRQAQEREERLAAAARAKEERARESAGLDRLGLPLDPGDPTRLRAIGRAWLASRTATHKDEINERSRWRRHLEVAFGDLLPVEVDAVRIRTFVEEKLATGLSSTSVGRCVGLLSSLFADLVEKGLAPRNPVETVPRAVRRLYRDRHDPRTTPFLETEADIRQLHGELTGTLRTLFAVAVTTALRPSELLALEWGDVNFTLRRVQVQRRVRMGHLGTPKSGHGRSVPLSPLALNVLREHRAATGETVRVFQPNGDRRFLEMAEFRDEWRAALARAGLPQMRFYDATRHTFASQWVMAGQPIEKLSKILGHSTVLTTERYAHLKPELLTVPNLFSFDIASDAGPDADGGAP